MHAREPTNAERNFLLAIMVFALAWGAHAPGRLRWPRVSCGGCTPGHSESTSGKAVEGATRSLEPNDTSVTIGA